jgi:hypothetical protein
MKRAGYIDRTTAVDQLKYLIDSSQVTQYFNTQVQEQKEVFALKI